MLTSAYYYGLYKPYMLQGGGYSRQSVKKDALRSLAAQQQNYGSGLNITKNNTIKKDVVDYANDIYKNVTEMRDSSKYVCQNADNYYMNVLNESFETAKEWACEDLSNFANAYNSAVSFWGSQEHSGALTNFGEDIQTIVRDNGELLENAGLSLTADGRTMSFNADAIHGLDYLDFGKALSQVAAVSEQTYGRTVDLLSLSIADHMDFRQLSYYYNYRVDRADGGSRPKHQTSLYSGILLDKII